MPESKNELSLGGLYNSVPTATEWMQYFCKAFNYYRTDGRKQMWLWPFLGNTSVNKQLFLIYQVPFQSKLLQNLCQSLCPFLISSLTQLMLMYWKSLNIWLPHPGNMPLKWLFNLDSPLPDRLTFAVCLYLLSRHLNMLTSNLALLYWPMSFLPFVGLLAKLEMQHTHSALYLPGVTAFIQIWPVKQAHVPHSQQWWVLTLKKFCSTLLILFLSLLSPNSKNSGVLS